MASGLNVLTFGASNREQKAVNPAEVLRDMRLRSQRELFDRHFRDLGMSIDDARVEDRYDIRLTRDYSLAAWNDGEIVFLEVPGWIMLDGDTAPNLDSLRFGFRERRVRFVSSEVERPCPTIRRVFKTWKSREQIDVRLIPWSDIGYLESGEMTLAEVLEVDSLPMEPVAAGTASVGTSRARRDCVFISYSHKDKIWFDRLKTHLDAFGDKIDVWSDEDIPDGQEWYPEIQQYLDRAKVAILLYTANFGASPFIRNHEVPRILEAAGKGELTLIWILVSSGHYDQLDLDDRQAAHDLSRPLDKMKKSERNEALTEITGKVFAAFDSD